MRLRRGLGNNEHCLSVARFKHGDHEAELAQVTKVTSILSKA